MRTTRIFASLLLSGALVTTVGVVEAAAPAGASATQPILTCNQGTYVSDSSGLAAITLKVGATTDPSSAVTYSQSSTPGLFHSDSPTAGAASDYAVSLCRNEQQGMDNVYGYSVEGVQTISQGADGGGTSWTALSSSDLSLYFTIIFTPQSTDVPLIDESHAKVISFSIDSAASNQVTLTVQPMPFTDILGCNLTPGQCAATPNYDNKCPDNNQQENPSNGLGVVCDTAANLSGAVRFQDTTAVQAADGSGGFSDLPGMALSYTSYVFAVGASCPTSVQDGASGLQISVTGPRYRQDGQSLNTPYVSAWIPAVAIERCFGTDPATFANGNVSVTRSTQDGVPDGTMSQGSTTTGDQGLVYTLTPDQNDGGLTLTIPQVTFPESSAQPGIVRLGAARVSTPKGQPRYTLSSKKGKSLAVKAVSLQQFWGSSLPAGQWLEAKVTSRSGYCVATSTSILQIKRYQGPSPKTCTFSVARYRVNSHKRRVAVLPARTGTLHLGS
jgi:hypothetical protein